MWRPNRKPCKYWFFFHVINTILNHAIACIVQFPLKMITATQWLPICTQYCSQRSLILRKHYAIITHLTQREHRPMEEKKGTCSKSHS